MGWVIGGLVGLFILAALKICHEMHQEALRNEERAAFERERQRMRDDLAKMSPEAAAAFRWHHRRGIWGPFNE
jgi:cell division protein ZapA (FtsZ GTPase activity inhibitor)